MTRVRPSTTRADVRLVAQILYYVVWLFLIVLLVRLVFDWVQALAREWRPHGAVLVVAEAVYTVTDPPLRALRRLIPPLTLGSIRLDLAFLVLVFLCWVLLAVLGAAGRLGARLRTDTPGEKRLWPACGFEFLRYRVAWRSATARVRAARATEVKRWRC